MNPKPLPFIVPRKFQPKNQQRLPERRTMTLVAALRGHEGLVMFDDTQETVSGYSKRTIDKIEVWDFPGHPFRFAIAGACTDATYADALQYELAEALMGIPQYDLRNGIVPTLSTTLTEFYKKHIWPRGGDRPQIEYLVAIQPFPKGYPDVLHISETAVNVVGVTTHTYSVGVGSYLTDYLLGRLLGGGEPIAQLCAAAVHVAKEVEQNIDGVGPMERAVIFDKWGGYDELAPLDIEEIADNLGGLNEATMHLFSLAADASLGMVAQELSASVVDAGNAMRHA